MSVVKMSKILVLCHKTMASEVLEKLQDSGLAQTLSCDQAQVAKKYEELIPKPSREKELRNQITQTAQAAEFLAEYWQGPRLTSIFKPLRVVSKKKYNDTVNSPKTSKIIEEANSLNDQISSTVHKINECGEHIAYLEPWENLKEPVETFTKLEHFFAFPAQISKRHMKTALKLCDELGCAFEEVSSENNIVSGIFAGPADKNDELHKNLRALDYNQVFFEGKKGTIEKLTNEILNEQAKSEVKLGKLKNQAQELAKELLDVQIYYDYLSNRLARAQTHQNLPVSEKVYFIEGWTRKKDFEKLEAMLNSFDGCTVSEIEPAKGEEPPIEIENKRLIEPFEVVTKLYGMPHYLEMDPTVLLAPFFALFFALCLTDAGYGLIMVALFIWLIRKMQMNKKFIILMLMCSVLTVFAGAVTGGWFGSSLMDLAVKYEITWLSSAITSITWFEPLSDPMKFMTISVALGVIQIMFGLCCGFVNALRREGLWAAVCDRLSWIVLIGSLICIALTFAGILPKSAAALMKVLAAVSAVWIFLFSHREGGITARLCMGGYNLFTAVFYIGDILSYLRLMALGMATGGIALAVNIIASIISDVPYAGPVLAILVLIGGHLFNMAQSSLGAFVHSMRLQFVEYYPKFFNGGGEEFTPFKNQYKFIHITETESI
ncbi:V-type ATP synthase subunit I [Limihaloglobus sulfuriphilus]|uniref:V-type ATP synthase subunit I n=1 Tax=Limihaloglobus sulfuriphilus TaxID=1851148 RepID=A0A1Q2MBX4_9BACT|nr:V-type ATP synthase subunit I [Limihaloglobus sulfuriphilus]AQQ69742.1 V-type ATP synthase subunit I [Limihaloglobus sulfuriphilus]